MGLPTNFENLYVEIAGYYAEMYVNLDKVEGEALNAVNAVVDIQVGDFNGNGRQLELILLNKFNQAYLASKNIKSSTVTVLDAVRAINNYVIVNHDESPSPLSGTGYAESASDARLRDFINNVAYEGSPECPDGWAQLSAEAGYVVDEWDTDAEE